MVELATRASNNHISRLVLRGKGNINNLGLQYREKFLLRGKRVYTGAAGKISDH